MKEQLHKRMRWQTVWNVMAEYQAKKLPAEEVCRWLGVSRTQLYRLRQRWIQWQDKQPSQDWLYQRPDRKRGRWKPEVEEFLRAECHYVKNQSPMFRGYYNFSFLAERVHRSFGVRLSRQAVRRFAIREGYFNPAVDQAKKAYVRFETGAIGMLFQHDASPHVWVPYTRRRDMMIATIDDHSRKLVGALLVPRDTAWHNLCVVRETVESYGCPVAYYVDNGKVYRPDKEPETQFGRALRSLGIELKFTKVRHPQSKGKIEKHFDYLQRRIPFLCERYKIKNLTQANKLLRDEIIPYYNEHHIHSEIEETPERRWQRALKENRSYLQPIPPKTPLETIFSLQFIRKLDGAGRFTLNGVEFTIPKGPRYKRVTLVVHPPYGPRQTKTRLTVLYKGSTLKQFVLNGKQILKKETNF